MPISFACPHCQHGTTVADQYAGKSGPCKSCGNTITIPTANSPKPASSLPPLGTGKASGAGTRPLPRPGMTPPSAKSSGGSGKTLAIVGVAVLAGLCLLCGVPAAFIGITGAIALPGAVGAAQDAAHRAVCSNNLKQIGLALHNYHDQYRSFPPAYTVDESGTKLHSWRTLILPFLEEQGLYSGIRLDEPWDSDHNRQFHSRMPAIFACPSGDETGTPGETEYLVIVGDNTLFPPDGNTVEYPDVLDGLSNTLAVVEVAGSGVNWMKPVDLELRSFSPIVGSGPTSIHSDHKGGANILIADGSVRFVTTETDPATISALVTRNGGEVIPEF